MKDFLNKLKIFFSVKKELSVKIVTKEVTPNSTSTLKNSSRNLEKDDIIEPSDSFNVKKISLSVVLPIKKAIEPDIIKLLDLAKVNKTGKTLHYIILKNTCIYNGATPCKDGNIDVMYCVRNNPNCLNINSKSEIMGALTHHPEAWIANLFVTYGLYLSAENAFPNKQSGKNQYLITPIKPSFVNTKSTEIIDKESPYANNNQRDINEIYTATRSVMPICEPMVYSVIAGGFLIADIIDGIPSITSKPSLFLNHGYYLPESSLPQPQDNSTQDNISFSFKSNLPMPQKAVNFCLVLYNKKANALVIINKNTTFENYEVSQPIKEITQKLYEDAFKSNLKK